MYIDALETLALSYQRTNVSALGVNCVVTRMSVSALDWGHMTCWGILSWQDTAISHSSTKLDLQTRGEMTTAGMCQPCDDARSLGRVPIGLGKLKPINLMVNLL